EEVHNHPWPGNVTYARFCRRPRASLRLRIMGVRPGRRSAERDGGARPPDRPGWWIFGCVIRSARRRTRCQLEVTDRLDPYPDRVAGEVGDRHLVHLHDLDAVRPGALGDRLVGGFALGRRQDLLPGRGPSAKILSTSPPTCAMRRRSRWRRRSSRDGSPRRNPAACRVRMLPPPTATRGSGSGEVRTLSPTPATATAIASSPPLTSSRSTRPARRESPRSASPAATARSVAVSRFPPKTGAALTVR